MRAGRFVVGGSRLLDYGWEVRRVGLQARKFVKAGPRVGRFVEALYILSPWSIICVTCMLKSLGVLRSWPTTN